MGVCASQPAVVDGPRQAAGTSKSHAQVQPQSLLSPEPLL